MNEKTLKYFSPALFVIFGLVIGILLTITAFAVNAEFDTRAELRAELRPRPRIIETIVHGQDARMWTVKVIGHMTSTPESEELCAYSIINEIQMAVVYSNTWGEIGRAVETRLALNGDTFDYGRPLLCKFKTMSVHVSDAEELIQ